VFGAGGGTSSYEELRETSDLIILWGSNARDAHPIFFHHVLKGVRNGARLYAVDPRRIYATGISNGAVFSHYLAAHLSPRIAAIAPVVGELLKHYHAFIETVRRMPKIVLSSVHGSAAGAGMGLAFVADLCIAADDARFTPAYAKIGVSPDGGSTVGMVGTVGVRRALQIFLAEDSFSAQQAYDWGLVAKVVPAAELKAATRKLAERLAQNPPAAIGGTKSLVYQAAVTPTRQQLDAEEEKIIDCMHTDEFRVAVKKFTTKSKT